MPLGEGGSGGRGADRSVLRALDSRSKRLRFESAQERMENVLLEGQLFFSFSFFSLLFRYPFHLRVTAVARKRSRSFCQKSRWQVTAKHSCTLRMWLCMK